MPGKSFLVLLLGFLVCLPNPSSAASDPPVYDVIVIGGGIAGLTAAFYLDDFDLLVLEKEQRVGGRATSGMYRGISYAEGAEYLGKPEPPLDEMISSLKLNLREIPPPVDVVWHKGRMYTGDYGKARLLVDESSLGEFNRFVQTILEVYQDYEELPETDLQGKLGRLDTITAQQWFDENSFSKIYKEVYSVAFRGIFGASLNEISALSAIPEMAFDFEGVEPVNESSGLEDEFAANVQSTGVYSFDGGIAEIPLALGQHLGDRLRTGTTVTKVERKGDLFLVSCLEAGNSTCSYQAESVLLATPSVVTRDIARSILSKEQDQLLESINYAPYATIALFSETPVFERGFDLAVVDDLIFTDIYDATWVARHYKRSRKKDNLEVTLIYAAPLSFKDNGLRTMPDQQLIDTVLTQLDSLFPHSSQHVQGHAITRFDHGLPVMTPGSYHRMGRLQQSMDNGLYLAGDYLIYPTFEAAALSGFYAAEKVMEWLED